MLGAWSGADLEIPVARVKLAEELGYDSVWSSEAYGADALGPLAYLAAVTDTIKLATAVVQIGARTPAANAMGFATIEALAGPGRVIVGLGLSGPQIIEGWYGTPWANPIARTRDTVAIMRQVFAREGPVEYEGDAISLPYHGPDATGVGKPLKSILRTNPDTPIFIAAGGPANVALAAEVADGWLPMGFSPANAASFRPVLEKGAARSGRSLDTLEIQAGCSVRITDDVGAVIQAAKPQLAFYVGGMGSRKQNFYNALVQRYGFEDAARTVQDLYLEGKRDEAAAALPEDLIDKVSLCGPPDVVRERLAVFRDAGVGTLMVSPMAWTFEDRLRQLQLVAELAA